MNKLNAKKSSRSTRKRVGRGNASGKGTYSSRGLKGQRSRSGGKKGLKLKGFKQNLLSFPKYKGMKSGRLQAQEISLTDLNSNFAAGDKVNPEALLVKGLISDMQQLVKVLNNGEINVKIELSGCKATASATAAIEAAGGKVIALPVKALSKKAAKAKEEAEAKQAKTK